MAERKHQRNLIWAAVIGSVMLCLSNVGGHVRASVLEAAGQPTLVYGDANLADEDAFVLLIFGDGFRADEQALFYEQARTAAVYTMNTSPYDELSRLCKVYAYGTVSVESGALGDHARNVREANEDSRDTCFGSHFWSYGMQRLLSLEPEDELKVEALQEEVLPTADYSILLVNSTVYGGSGGNICVASLHESSMEILLHELGHTVAKLADEYWAGDEYAEEAPNMTTESDPKKVRWSSYVGVDGVGVYPYSHGKEGWYKPSENCKMQYLGKEYEFCDVCKEAIRKAVCEQSSPEAVRRLLGEQDGEITAGNLPQNEEAAGSPGQESLVDAEGQKSVTDGSGAETGHGADLPEEGSMEESPRSSGVGQSVPGEGAGIKENPSVISSDDDISLSTAAVIFVVSAALIVIVNWQGKGRRHRR
ncbi:MAG TPA: hypothetical protein DF613_00170 [Lachnospiraceae bacterium]|nr:hypothetical protein [Lachnospiraceae bacterium]